MRVQGVEGGMGEIDDMSPIPQMPAVTASPAEFDMPNAGSFPYFCSSHEAMGMFGVIYVE